MGYYAKTLNVDVQITVDRISDSLVALKSLPTRSNTDSSIQSAETVKEALEAIGFTVFTSESGSVVIDGFGFECMPTRTKEYMHALAPFISSYSGAEFPLMVWADQDDELWTWVFSEGVLISSAGYRC